MAGSRLRARSGQTLAFSLGTALLLTACGGSESPITQPPPPTQVAPVVAPPPAPLPPPIREVQPKSRSKVTVIDPGEAGDEPKTLLEASRLAKAQNARGRARPVAEITDENVGTFGEGADVIIMESPPAAELPTPAELDAATRAPDGIRDEEYWRNRALELRMAWRRTVDEMAELQLQSAALRQKFYAEDDPYIRDSQIKPNWDRVIDRLESLRRTSKRYSDELDAFLDDGRREGALQGWLNEGWELEPTSDELLRFSPTVGEVDQIDEPTTFDPGMEPGGDPSQDG